MYFNNYNQSDYTIFIGSMDDLNSEIDSDKIGQPFVFLKLEVYCKTCGKVLEKKFISEEKAQAYGNKHTGYKKYTGHEVEIRNIQYPIEITIADIAGTDANRTKLRNLKQQAGQEVFVKASEILRKYKKTISDLEDIFGMVYRGNNLEDVQENGSKITSVRLRFSNENVRGEMNIEELLRCRDLIEDRKEIYSDKPFELEGFQFDSRTIDGLFNRVKHMHHEMHVSTGSRFDRNYAWEFKYNLTVMKGFDAEEVPECAFCELPINSWNDVAENIHDDGSGRSLYNKIVHRKCTKCVLESSSLYSYTKKIQNEVVA